MRLNNNDRIITDDDIVMTNGDMSLANTIQSIEKKVNTLNSNVKWIYKYGGVGSGTGGGGGTTQEFSIFALLNGIQLKDQLLILNNTGYYPLVIKINNPNGMLFNVLYQYTTISSTGNTVTVSLSLILSIENNYTLETQINLNNNATLTVTATDGNSTKLVSCDYVTSPYTFDISLVNNSGVELNNEIFIDDAKKHGVNVKVLYNVAVQASITYIYSFNGEETEGTITDLNNSILFPIDSELFEEQNAGMYSANFDLLIIPQGLELILQLHTVLFSLIPSSLYMLINPEVGTIYELETENPYLYQPGYITFLYRIYENISQNRTYTVTIKVNDEIVLNQTVVERLQYNFKIFSVTPGLNKLEVIASRTTSYSKTYYFYIDESSIDTDYFDNPEEWVLSYYRISETTSLFANYKNNLYIEQTTNNNIINIDNISIPNTSANDLINTHVAIGLQYNAINIDNAVILNFYNASVGSTPVAYITQNAVTRSGSSTEWYIKKLNNVNKDNTSYYHLIQLYSQFVKRIGNEYYYELSIYIDGVLENVFGLLTNSPLLISSIDIPSVNCFINTIDIDYKIVEEQSKNNCDYEVYKYFLAYKSKILREDVNNELLLVNYLNNFLVGLDGRVITDLATINNVANNISTPVMIMTCDNRLNTTDIMSQIERNYGEDGSGLGSDLNFLVSIQWGPGNSGVSDLSMPSGYSTAIFRAALQGSSTKLYRVKNFTLSIENTDDSEQADIYLYSPNFEDGNTSTFLPETEFTLKADVVDSSHSNNTSCGKFINTVCRKFSEDINDNGYYKGYIRNCLEGFPFLMFFCVIEKDKLTLEDVTTYYYFGVYNFNLGRSSYYNLGYKDSSVFGTADNKQLTNAGNGFTFFKISQSLNILKEGLGVAEIQGGSNYFDFSLYDPSVIFLLTLSGGYIDNNYMFGDIVYGSNSTLDLIQNKISLFVLRVAFSGGYLFDYLKKRRGDYSKGYNAEKEVDGVGTGESLNQVPDYTKQYKRVINATGSWEYQLKEETRQGTLNDLQELIIPDVDLGRLQYLNFQSISEYYTICMALGLVDSVMKNLNIKTWNGTTWYPAFYDMDTCLGINNQGNDITYFAFSDYWSTNILRTVGNVDYPSDAQIYRDFSPSSLGENGFDVPTNYLFTIAKYAKLIFNDNTSELAIYTSVYPQELYAKWRSNTVNNDTNEGVLKNADSFMDKFFTNNLGSICPALISYNYRSKYLSLGSDLQSLTWVSTDYNKFNGTRVNKVRDWLEGRLHILDAYFNLNTSFINNIQYLDENDTWQLLIQGAPVVDITYNTQTYDLQNNEDIIILHDIFTATGGLGVQLSGNVSFLIKCPENSPLQIYNATGGIRRNYIIGGDNYQQIEFLTTGVQGVKLGGSQTWSYLQDINWLSTSTLSITSDKLENLYGNRGSISAILLNTPNIRSIQLNSSLYTATLNLEGVDNYPNLLTIDISNSKLSLNINNLNIKNLNLSNINNPQASISVTNCNLLETINYNNVTLQLLQLLGLKGSLKNLKISNTHISNINVLCTEEDGTLTIENDSAVEFITVDGFKTVKILGCSRLQRITINSSSIPVLKLYVLNCLNEKLAITSEASYLAGKVTMGNSQITFISLNNSSGITDIELPDSCTIDIDGCKNLYLLNTLTGNNIRLFGTAFENCYVYSLKDKEGAYSDLHVNSDATNLSKCFSNNEVITFEDIKHFINECIPDSNSVTNTSSMCSMCTNIKFDLTDLLLYDNDTLINFAKLNKVTNADHMFGATSIYALHSTFYDIGSLDGCSFRGYVSPYKVGTDPEIMIPIHVLKNNNIKFTTWSLSRITDEYNANRMVFLDDDYLILPENSTVSFKEFLTGGTSTYPINLKEFGDILCTKYLIDFEDSFDSSMSKLYNLWWIRVYNYINIDHLLYNLPALGHMQWCFPQPNNSLLPVDLYTVVNWDNFIANCKTGIINTKDAIQATDDFFGFPKYISVDNYHMLCDKILSASNITEVNDVFKNCTIIGNLQDFTFGTGSVLSNSITRVGSLWENCKSKAMLDSVSEEYLQLADRFFKNVPNLSDCEYCFKGCKFNKPISFDFFAKRELDLANSLVWVKVNDEYKEATYYSYRYRDLIKCTAHMFENCTWSNDAKQYDPTRYIIDSNKVLYNDEEYDTYYTRTLISSNPIQYRYDEHTVSQPTEITDAQNLTGGYVLEVLLTTTNIVYTNPSISGSKDKLIIPPDFFYCLNSDTSSSYRDGISYTFACSNALNGIIPEHIFKNNNNSQIDNCFKNQIIIPKLTYTWTDDGNTTNVYVHYPANYTVNSNLSYAFNSIPIILLDSTNTYNYSIVLCQDTISSNTSLLQYAFDCELGSYTSTNRLETYLDNNKFNYIGTVYGNSIVLGFDMTKFTNLYMDNMLTSPMNNWLYGNLFNSSFDTANIVLRSYSSKVMLRRNVLNESYSLSPLIILPKASAIVTSLSDYPYTINSTQITDALTSRQYYESAGWTINN